MRVLLVEDDTMIGDAVQQGLRKEGFVVDWVQDVADAELALSTHPFELLLLDLGLPGRPGIELLKKIRTEGNGISVLILTARDSVSDRITGLDSGADDYIVKPFDLDELCARIRAVQRRRQGRSEPVLVHGKLSLNPATRECRWQGVKVALSGKELSLLEALLENPGKVLSREQLEDRLYGWGEEVESNAVGVHIHNLRKKLGADVIRTIRGVGYLIGNLL